MSEMKTIEETCKEILVESFAKKAAATLGMAGAMGLSAMVTHMALDSNYHPVHHSSGQVTSQEGPKSMDPSRESMVNHIVSKYNVPQEKASSFVDSAYKHAHAGFPTVKDIVGVMGVESSFNPAATSKLKRDPAKGLMQVRLGVNGIDPKEFNTIDGQVRHGAGILRANYMALGNREGALHAYNVGIGNHLKNPNKNPRYAAKIDKEISEFSK